MNLTFVLVPVLTALVNGNMVLRNKKTVSFQGIVLICMVTFVVKSIVELFSSGEVGANVFSTNAMFLCMALDNVYNRRSTQATIEMMGCLIILIYFLQSNPSPPTAVLAVMFWAVFLPNDTSRLSTGLHYGILVLLVMTLICDFLIDFSSSLGEYEYSAFYLDFDLKRLSNIVGGFSKLSIQ